MNKKYVYMSLMIAVGYLLMFFQVPLLPVAPWMTIDFSFIVVLVIALAYGNVDALIVTIIINLLNYLSVGSPVGLPVGQISNIVAIFGYLSIVVYWQKRDKFLTGAIIGSSGIAFIMSVLNYLWITPWYFSILGIPLPTDFLWYCVSVVGVFNLIRWSIIGIVNLIMKKTLQIFVNRMK